MDGRLVQEVEDAWRFDKEGHVHVQMCNKGWNFTICHWGDRLFTSYGVLEDPIHRRTPTEAADIVWDFFCQD